MTKNHSIAVSFPISATFALKPAHIPYYMTLYQDFNGICDCQKPTSITIHDKLFSSSLIRDVNDLFGKNNSQRQFYTVPGNSIPNDQDTFAKWLYATPKTCKEGNGLQCAANMYGVNKGPLGD